MINNGCLILINLFHKRCMAIAGMCGLCRMGYKSLGLCIEYGER